MVSQWNEYYSNNKPNIVTVVEEQLEKQRQLFRNVGEELKRIDNEYAEETQKQYNEMMSGTKKMTREEAKKKVENDTKCSRLWASHIVEALEALGLIEFTINEIIEPETLINTKLREIRDAYNSQLPCCIVGEDIIHYLEDNGYVIKRKD